MASSKLVSESVLRSTKGLIKYCLRFIFVEELELFVVLMFNLCDTP